MSASDPEQRLAYLADADIDQRFAKLKLSLFFVMAAQKMPPTMRVNQPSPPAAAGSGVPVTRA